MLAWLTHNWFDLIQTVGIAGSLLAGRAGLRFDTKVRRTQIHLDLTESHRSIWERMIKQPALSRILDSHVNLAADPLRPEEHRFVVLVIMHIEATRQAIQSGVFIPPSGMDDDVRELLAFPIPHEVAKAILPFQSRELREYLEALMKQPN